MFYRSLLHNSPQDFNGFRVWEFSWPVTIFQPHFEEKSAFCWCMAGGIIFLKNNISILVKYIHYSEYIDFQKIFILCYSSTYLTIYTKIAPQHFLGNMFRHLVNMAISYGFTFAFPFKGGSVTSHFKVHFFPRTILFFQSSTVHSLWDFYHIYRLSFLCGFLVGRPISSSRLLTVESDMDTPDSTKSATRSVLHYLGFLMLFPSSIGSSVLVVFLFLPQISFLKTS